MERRGLERFAPLSGVVFLVLAVASFVIGGEPPSVEDSTAEVVEFWKDNEGSQLASAILAAWAAVALVWFGGSLREAVVRAEGGPSRLGSIALGGTIVAAAGITVNGALQFAAVDAADDVPPEVLQTISVLYVDMFFPMAVGIALFLLASGTAAIRHGAFDRRLGWIALVIGVLAITPAGFFAFIASLAWVGLAGVVLYRKKDPVGSGAAPPPTAGGPSIEVPPGAGPPSPA